MRLMESVACRTAFMTSAASLVPSPVVGSSKKRIFGSETSSNPSQNDEYMTLQMTKGKNTHPAILPFAIVTLFRTCLGRPSPSFSRPMILSPHSSISMSCITRRTTSSLFELLGSRQFAVKRRVSKTDRYGLSMSCCSAYPLILFQVARSLTLPSMRTSPVIVPPVLYPAMTSRKVLLPAPLVPIRHVIRPHRKCTLTLSSSLILLLLSFDGTS